MFIVYYIQLPSALLIGTRFGLRSHGLNVTALVCHICTSVFTTSFPARTGFSLSHQLVLLSTAMSLTEVYSETRDGRTFSRGTITLRGRSPNPHDSDNRRSFEKSNEIELAQLGTTGDAGGSNSGASRVDLTLPAPEDAPKISKWTEYIQFATLTFALFLEGWNDGTTGPLLPRIQSNYHVRRYGTLCLATSVLTVVAM